MGQQVLLGDVGTICPLVATHSGASLRNGAYCDGGAVAGQRAIRSDIKIWAHSVFTCGCPNIDEIQWRPSSSSIRSGDP